MAPAAGNALLFSRTHPRTELVREAPRSRASWLEAAPLRPFQTLDRPGFQRPPAQGRLEDRLRPSERNIPAWRATGVPTHNSSRPRGWTSVHRSGKLPPHRTEPGHMACAILDKPASTNSAESDTAQNILHPARSRFRIDNRHGRNSSQGAIGMLEPALRTLQASQGFGGDRDQARRRRCRLRGERSSALASSFKVNPEARISSSTTAGRKPRRIASHRSRSLERARPTALSPPRPATTARNSLTILSPIIATNGAHGQSNKTQRQ